jgi:hypothetical protein
MAYKKHGSAKQTMSDEIGMQAMRRCGNGKGKRKGKGYPITGQEGPEGE